MTRRLPTTRLSRRRPPKQPDEKTPLGTACLGPPSFFVAGNFPGAFGRDLAARSGAFSRAGDAFALQLTQRTTIRYTAGMSTERLIKKYANRRLYDASISKHVTLGDIRQMIVDGERIRVVEDKTNEDITRLILLQVISEQEQFGRPILTTQLLESIIRFYGGPMQDFMSRYLETSVEAFMKQQESLQQQVAQMLNAAPPPMNAMAEMARQNMELWTRMQEGMLGMFGAKAAKMPATGAPDEDEAETEPGPG
jgi:polyhydroxyalkanoate synthesis repressor PhaR